jgi:hypothetical protein
MTDVEIIEKQIAQLTDRLDRCIARNEALVIERQSLGYDLHINDSKEAKTRGFALARGKGHACGRACRTEKTFVARA